MYNAFYELQREPFHVTPDPEFLFPSPAHKEALASIIYGIEQRKGFVAITGEVGVGKTTIQAVTRLHEALIEVYRKNQTVVLIIDEAQNMPVETLESLRMLSNLETVTEKL